MNVFDFFFVRIKRIDIVDADMEDILVSTVHEITPTMNAPPKMFVGAAILRVHTLQYAGHMNARLTAPHTDCGIEDFSREIEFGVDGMNAKEALKVYFARAMVT